MAYNKVTLLIARDLVKGWGFLPKPHHHHYHHTVPENRVDLVVRISKEIQDRQK